jgi:glycosyltransferase involved in cell wall biosynthesis
MSNPQVSIIIPAHNEAHRLQETVRAVQATADAPYEIVVVDDGSTDGCANFLADGAVEHARRYRSETRLGVAGARNWGARHARGSILFFMDGHCYPEAGFLSRMTQALARLGRGMVVPQVTVLGNPLASGFGVTLSGPSFTPTWLPAQLGEPYPVPAGCGCCQMFFRAWFDQIGGYDAMRSYGVEDLEISVRTWLLGGPVRVAPAAVVAHYFRSRTTCHATWPDVVFNSLRLAHLHFSGEPLRRIRDHWRGYAGFAEADQWLAESDYRERRAWLDERRRHSAEWYCAKFAIPI